MCHECGYGYSWIGVWKSDDLSDGSWELLGEAREADGSWPQQVRVSEFWRCQVLIDVQIVELFNIFGRLQCVAMCCPFDVACLYDFWMAQSEVSAYFRVHVVYNAKTAKYVLWVNVDDCPDKSAGGACYAVGTSSTPEGPFAFVFGPLCLLVRQTR